MNVQELHDNYGAPLQCPSCGYDLIIDGVDLRCANPDCRAQKIYRIEHFIKKLGVMNASYKTLDNFGIDSYEKLLSFRPNPSKAMEKKLADELVNKVFRKSPEDIFAALNIRDLGEKIQKKIIGFYGWKNISDPSFGFEGGLPSGIGDITLSKFKDARLENLRVTDMFVKDIRYSWTESAEPVSKQVRVKKVRSALPVHFRYRVVRLLSLQKTQDSRLKTLYQKV